MSDFRASSPTSDIFSDEVVSVSLRDKSLLKRSVSKHHNNNFKAGYVPVHEQHLNKTGLRGRKTFAFWTLVALLFILAAGNLLLTVTILGVLRLGQGMQSIELVPEAHAVKFFGRTDLGYLYKRDGRIEGFEDAPVHISADESSLLLNLIQANNRASNKLAMGPNGTYFRRLQSFCVRGKSGESVFSTAEPHFRALKGVKHLQGRMVKTNRIRSAVGETLRIEGRVVVLKGAEGTTIDGKEMVWNANEDIFLKSDNGSIVLSGSEGTYIDVKQIPVASLRQGMHATSQYKICVCMPQGKLFRIPVSSGSRVYCHHVTMQQHNPCM